MRVSPIQDSQREHHAAVTFPTAELPHGHTFIVPLLLTSLMSQGPLSKDTTLSQFLFFFLNAPILAQGECVVTLSWAIGENSPLHTQCREEGWRAERRESVAWLPCLG